MTEEQLNLNHADDLRRLLGDGYKQDARYPRIVAAVADESRTFSNILDEFTPIPEPEMKNFGRGRTTNSSGW